jgi:hypothetical protein
MDFDQVGERFDSEVREGHDAFGALTGSVDPDQSGLRVHPISYVREEGLILAEHLGDAVDGGLYSSVTPAVIQRLARTYLVGAKAYKAQVLSSSVAE